MLTFEDPAVFADFMNAQLEQPMAYKIDSTGRAVYRCVRDFGPLRTTRGIIPKIVDFGASVRFDGVEDRFIHPIQPDHYRAPEVILGCGWGISADIWNLGILVRLPVWRYTLTKLTRVLSALGSHTRQRTVSPCL